MKTVIIEKLNKPSDTVVVKYCDSFLSKFLGLMFRKGLPENSGALLVESRESKIDTSIHMLFMHFDLAVLWLDKDRVVVDKILAKKWSPFYFPKKPAQYVLELHAIKFTEYEIGDKLEFKNLP